MSYCPQCGGLMGAAGTFTSLLPPPQGWECPKCGSVYAPSIGDCARCRPPDTPTGNSGSGYVSLAIKKAGLECVLVEPSLQGAVNARTRGVDPIICSTLQDAGFQQNSMHAFGLFDVLEHIEEDLSTLRALKEMLAEGGRVLLTVPAYKWLWSAHDEFLHHKRRYSAGELKWKLDDAALRLDRLSYFNTLLFPLAVAARCGLRSRSPGAEVPAAPINCVLQRVFGAERWALKSLDLPFGLSLLAIASAE